MQSLFRKLMALILVFALLAMPGMANAQSSKPVTSPADPELQKVFQEKLEAYTQGVKSASESHFVLGEIHSDGRYAYDTAQAVDGQGQATVESYVVLLAQNDPNQGWYALAPGVDSGEVYDTLLNSFPESLIDESTKAYLQQPASSGETPAAVTNVNQHKLPFPAANTGHVSTKDGSGHENQVDFNVAPSLTIFASKAGRVVFVKQSSSSTCWIAPPDPCWQKANMVVVQHSATEYSWYVHLAYNSVPVSLNSYVSLGTKIGVEGTTGYSSGNHLHYMTSTGHTAWTDPNNPDAAPWATGITATDFDEVSWSNLQLNGTYTSQNTSDPSAVSWGAGRMDVFAKGENNGLYHRAYNGSWGSWELVPDGILTSAPDAASWGSGHFDVYVCGIDNNIYYRRYLNGAWSGWLSAGAPPGGATSAPSATSWGNNRIDLFVRGSDNALWHRVYSNGGWGSWESLNGVLTTGPDAASWGVGHIDIVVAGLNNVLWRYIYNEGQAGQWQQLPDGATTYDMGVASPSANRFDLFARGTDGKLYHRRWLNSWGTWEDLGGSLTAGVDAASGQSGYLDVFVRGTDNMVYHRWQQNDGVWSNWESLSKP